MGSQDSSFAVVTNLWAERSEVWQWQEVYLFPRTFVPFLGPTQPRVGWVPAIISLE